MDDYCNLSMSRRSSLAVLAAPIFAYTGLTLLSPNKRKPYPHINNTNLNSEKNLEPVEADYVLVNEPGGVVFKNGERETMMANLYIDNNTIKTENPWTKLELTSRLNINPFLLAIARRLKKTDRKSPIITREDIVSDFTKISKLYELSSESYSPSNTTNLESMLRSDGAVPESMPLNYQIEIISDNSLSIFSYTDTGEEINKFNIENPEQITAYRNWIKERSNHAYEELQKTNNDGTKTTNITHMSFFIKNKLQIATTLD